jgi:putative phage-type endonuclease
MLTQSQHKARSKGLGGSDAATVLGLSPWKSPSQLFLEKTGRVQAASLDDKEAVQWGNILEAPIAAEFAKRTGLKVRRDNRSLRHPDHPFMVGHIDRRIQGERQGLEIKAIGLRSAADWTDGVPPYYQAQVDHYLALTGFEGFHVAALVGGQQLKTYYIERNPSRIDYLIEREAAFWRHVETRTPPPPIDLADAVEYLKHITHADGMSVADAAALAAADALRELKAQLDALGLQKSALEDLLKATIADGEGLITPDGRPLATWKPQTTRRLDTSRLRADHPELYDEYSTETSSRVFRLGKSHA